MCEQSCVASRSRVSPFIRRVIKNKVRGWVDGTSLGESERFTMSYVREQKTLSLDI